MESVEQHALGDQGVDVFRQREPTVEVAEVIPAEVVGLWTGDGQRSELVRGRAAPLSQLAWLSSGRALGESSAGATSYHEVDNIWLAGSSSDRNRGDHRAYSGAQQHHRLRRPRPPAGLHAERSGRTVKLIYYSRLDPHRSASCRTAS